MIYCVGFYYLLMQNRKMEILVMVCLMIGGMTDPFLFNTSLKNIGMLFLGAIIYQQVDFSTKTKIIFLPKFNSCLNKSHEFKISYGGYRKILTKRLAILFGIIALSVA